MFEFINSIIGGIIKIDIYAQSFKFGIIEFLFCNSNE